MSTSKSKDPLVVMEDAKQLFLVRKEYIHIALDLVIEIKDLSKGLNALLIGLNTDLWKNKLNMFSQGVVQVINSRNSGIKYNEFKLGMIPII